MSSRLLPKFVAAAALAGVGLLAAPNVAEAGDRGHRHSGFHGHYGVPSYGYNRGYYRGPSHGYNHGYYGSRYGSRYGSFNRGYGSFDRGFGYNRGFGSSRGLTIGTGNFFLNIRR